MKKVIPIFLLCIVVLLCFVGCSNEKTDKAYNVNYDEEGYVESVTILFKLDKDLKSTEEIYFDYRRQYLISGDFTNEDNFGYGLFSSNKEFIEFDIDAEYDRFKDLKSYRCKGESIIFKIIPKAKLKEGCFSFFKLDFKNLENNSGINGLREDLEKDGINVEEAKQIANAYSDYFQKYATKYTFTF